MPVGISCFLSLNMSRSVCTDSVCPVTVCSLLPPPPLPQPGRDGVPSLPPSCAATLSPSFLYSTFSALGCMRRLRLPLDRQCPAVGWPDKSSIPHHSLCHLGQETSFILRDSHVLLYTGNSYFRILSWSADTVSFENFVFVCWSARVWLQYAWLVF